MGCWLGLRRDCILEKRAHATLPASSVRAEVEFPDPTPPELTPDTIIMYQERIKG